MTNQSLTWKRLVRFIANDGKEYCGEPEDSHIDVGLAVAAKEDVKVKVLATKTAFDSHAQFTGETKSITKLLSPITQSEVGTIRCIGLNYKDHAAELGLDLPKVPELFTKPATSLHDPCNPIVVPEKLSHELDAEVEVAIVIGKDAKNVSAHDALQYVLGYTVANDLTCRDVQKTVSQWGYAKGFDAFCPLGPTLVSAESLGDPSKLQVKTTLNGFVMQDQSASNMIFTIAEIISYLSVGTTLQKGTVILTGTPKGIGASYTPPRFLKQGDDLKVWISHGLGTLTNTIKLQ